MWWRRGKNEINIKMDFFKKVVGSVGIASSGLAPGFPYVADELVSSSSEVGASNCLWTIHRGHNVSFKKVFLLFLDGRKDVVG